MRNQVKNLVNGKRLREAMTVLRTLPPENASQFVPIVASLGLKAKEILDVKERDETLIFAVTFIVTYGQPSMIMEIMKLLGYISNNTQENISFKNAIEKQLSAVVYAPIRKRILSE